MENSSAMEELGMIAMCWETYRETGNFGAMRRSAQQEEIPKERAD
jgi:hypothetical protein